MALYLFDLIGTLADASRRYAYAFNRVCKENGIEPPPTEDVLERLGNKNLIQIIEEFIPDMPAEQYESFMAQCNGRCDGLLDVSEWHEDLYEGVRDMLQTLKDQGHQLGIYTGTRDDALAKLMEYHALDELFDARFVRAKNNERDGMIDPEDIKIAQLQDIVATYRQAGFENNHVIVIGDSTADFEAAEKVGLDFFGFAPTARKEEKFKAVGARVTFSNFPGFPLPRVPQPPRPGNSFTL